MCLSCWCENTCRWSLRPVLPGRVDLSGLVLTSVVGLRTQVRAVVSFQLGQRRRPRSRKVTAVLTSPPTPQPTFAAIDRLRQPVIDSRVMVPSRHHPVCVHCLSLPFLVLEFTAVSFAEGGLGRKRVFLRRTPAGGGGRGAGGLDLLPAQTRVNPPHGTECSSALRLAACHETMARTSSQNAFGPGQRVVFVGQMHQMPHLHCLPALRIAAQRQ